MTVRAAALLAALVLTAGCSGSGEPQAAPTLSPPPVVATPSETPCPEIPGKPFTWPASVPADLPKPPGASYVSTTTSSDRVTIVRLTSTMSLQQSVLFVLRNVGKVGYTLGRGDAEPAEADAPFGKGDVRGLYKMLVRDTCSTDWLIAVAQVSPNGGSPLLPRGTPGPSSSPLPFG